MFSRFLRFGSWPYLTTNIKNLIYSNGGPLEDEKKGQNLKKNKFSHLTIKNFELLWKSNRVGPQPAGPLTWPKLEPVPVITGP